MALYNSPLFGNSQQAPAPTGLFVTATDPAALGVDVSLGSSIKITFNEDVDQSSVSAETFGVTYPGTPIMVNSDGLIGASSTGTSRQSVVGHFHFPESKTIQFDPNTPFQPNTQYTVLLVGARSVVSAAAIKALSGDVLADSLQFTFTTIPIQTNQTPVQSPVSPLASNVPVWMRPALTSDDIVVRPRADLGNDLSQVIELIFPAPIDPTTFDPADLGLQVEPFLNDPLVYIPPNLTVSYKIQDNVLQITVSGWTN